MSPDRPFSLSSFHDSQSPIPAEQAVSTVTVIGGGVAGLSAACALGYVDFRLPELEWRATRPKLSAWFTKFSAYESMKATTPANP